jgi:hypothetical protein
MSVITILQLGFCAHANSFPFIASSADCAARISHPETTSDGECMHKVVCGSLNTISSTIPFSDHLSGHCTSVFQRYNAQSKSDVLAALKSQHLCLRGTDASYPSNPVVVQQQSTRNFALCSIPKAGSSKLRALLAVLTRHPSPVGWMGPMLTVHRVPFPTAWHFERPQDIPTSFPFFMVGRNPYTRMLCVPAGPSFGAFHPVSHYMHCTDALPGCLLTTHLRRCDLQPHRRLQNL